MLNFIGIFWTVWRGGGSVHVTDKLEAGRNSAAMESRPLSGRKQESWEQPSCNQGTTGEQCNAQKQSWCEWAPACRAPGTLEEMSCKWILKAQPWQQGAWGVASCSWLTQKHCQGSGHTATHGTTAWGKHSCGHHLDIPGCGILGW